MNIVLAHIILNGEMYFSTRSTLNDTHNVIYIKYINIYIIYLYNIRRIYIYE